LIPKYYQYDFKNFYATVIQRAYRNYKKRPESLAKQIWEAVRNDGIPDRKKFLGISSHGQMKINPMMQEEYALNLDNFIVRFKKNSKYLIENYNLDKMATAYKEYIYFDINEWIEQKKYQLSQRLDKEAHDLVKEILKRQGYRGDYSAQWGFQIVYHPWRYIIESLQNPEKYFKKYLKKYL
jgi:hypothetical protein